VIPTCAKPPIIAREEALALADRVERGEVTAADPPVIAALVRQYVELTDLLREKNASIHRFQQLVFASRSERRARDSEDDAREREREKP
jgi:hypothetical protein